jgi:hypothetical protein
MISVVVGLNLLVLAAAEAAKGARGAAPRDADAPREAGGVLRVRALEVVDGAGNVLIRLGVDENGEAGVVTMSPGGVPLTLMGQQDGAGMFATFDPDGRALVVISEDEKGRARRPAP